MEKNGTLTLKTRSFVHYKAGYILIAKTIAQNEECIAGYFAPLFLRFAPLSSLFAFCAWDLRGKSNNFEVFRNINKTQNLHEIRKVYSECFVFQGVFREKIRKISAKYEKCIAGLKIYKQKKLTYRPYNAQSKENQPRTVPDPDQYSLPGYSEWCKIPNICWKRSGRCSSPYNCDSTIPKHWFVLRFPKHCPIHSGLLNCPPSEVVVLATKLHNKKQ